MEERLDPAQLEREALQLAPDLTVDFFQADRDNWPDMQARIDQYMAGGVRLGWLVDIDEKVAYIFRQGQPGVAATVKYDGYLDGEDVLPGFRPSLKDLYERHYKPE